MNESIVKNYYSTQVHKEWRRLARDAYHRLEFDTTLHFLQKYLPEGGLVLDAGGGPGRYTLELARRGYKVILFDLVPENLAFAKRQVRRQKLKNQVRSFEEGSLVDLSRFANGTFDAVICLGGPLSHILDPRGRDRAVSELVRVARDSAPIFVSVIARLSLLVMELTLFQHEIETPQFIKIRDTGDYPGNQGFTACHIFLPEDFRSAFAGQDVTILEMAGLEGMASNHRYKLNQLARNSARWQIWYETHLQTCTHPAVLGMSEHMLLVCRKNSSAHTPRETVSNYRVQS